MRHFYVIIVTVLLTLRMSVIPKTHATTMLSAAQVAENIANRSTNKARVGFMHFTMRNSAGSERKRSALLIHSQTPKQTKIGIYFTEPAGLRDTSFLSHDNSDSTDQNWLYLPATERVRKLPSSSRGDYFMGTDLSYGDIKDNFKFALEDWDFSLGEQKLENGKNFYMLKGIPKNNIIKEELGYASFIAKIDPQTWFPVNIQYTDTDNTPLKEVSILALEMIEGTWTASHFLVFNSQLVHQTEIVISDMQAAPDLPSDLLKADELPYGAPLSLLKKRG
jgi:hypothetical protein